LLNLGVAAPELVDRYGHPWPSMIASWPGRIAYGRILSPLVQKFQPALTLLLRQSIRLPMTATPRL
jgi:hypothetical protein